MKFSGKNFQPWPDFDIDIEGLTIVIGPSNEGKCLAPGTPVLMYDGTTKNVEDVRIADLLMGPDSQPRRVLSLAHGWDEMYDVVPKKGDPWRCNSVHVLPVMVTGEKLRRKCLKYKVPIEITPIELLKRGRWLQKSARLQRSTVLVFPNEQEVFDPYLVGIWLGDGTTDLRCLAVTSADVEVVNYLNKTAKQWGLNLRENRKSNNAASTYTFSGGRHWSGCKQGHSQNPLLSEFRCLKLVNKGLKHVPMAYKTSPPACRLQLLAGLLDSDGGLEGNKQFEFVSKFETLATDVAFVARSLGFRASIKPTTKKCQTGNGGIYFRVRIAGKLTCIPTLIPRKQATRNSGKNPLLTGFNVVPVGWGEYFGFQLNGDGLFLLGDFTIAHNSSIYRALRGILRNDINEGYIRNPKKEPLALKLEHDGHTITASRSKRGVQYEVDGLMYAKLDGNVPPIVKDLKFNEIRLGDFTFDPIFASQNRPQFLIDNETFKPSEINAILGAFGGTEKLEAGKKQANLLKTQKDGEARILASQIRDAEERKAKLEIMAINSGSVADELLELESSSRKLEAESIWLEEASFRYARSETLQQIADELILPDVSEAESIQQISVQAEQAAFSVAFVKWADRPLHTVESVSTAWDDAEKNMVLIRYAEWAARASERCSWVEKPLAAIDGLAKSWKDSIAVWNQAAALETVTGLIAEQADIRELENFRIDIATADLVKCWNIVGFLESSVASRRAMKETKQALIDIDEQLSDAQTDLSNTQKVLHDVTICPKCGKSREHVCG